MDYEKNPWTDSRDYTDKIFDDEIENIIIDKEITNE